MDKLKCFFYDSPHIFMKCPQKFALKKQWWIRPWDLVRAQEVSKPRRLNGRRSQWSASCVMVCIGCGSVRGSLSSKGTMEQTRSPRSLVRAREKPKPIGQKGTSLSWKGTMEKTRSPRSLVRPREKPKPRGQRGAKRRKATSEHDESSEGLPPKEEMSLSLNLEKEVVMKTVKLGPMRLKSSEASEWLSHRKGFHLWERWVVHQTSTKKK
ncbi:hypothetical protein PVK06_005876 [Gossypium arboreum]|uniref:Uncharacterized protein n=1 Tax=Gossypium arboreum TaxID=29729 RepID=A0ABR0QW73_GOSAR|nr:hypothetical protein PVK06_005876 [Gossypium arboreum]